MEANEFQIGGRYRNQKGAYEVLAIDGSQMRVRYDSGAEEELERSFQAKVMSRIEREEASAFPTGLPDGKQADFAWTLGVIASRGQLHPLMQHNLRNRRLAAVGFVFRR